MIVLIVIGPVKQKTKKVIGDFSASFVAIREGFNFVIKHPIIFPSMILDFFASFFSSANTLMPFIARDLLHLNEVGYGWLSAAQSIGAVLMGFVISQRNRIRRQGPILFLAVFLFGLFTVAFGLSRSFWAAFITLILVGAGDDVSTILRNTIRQLNTPDHMRGRMISLTAIFFQGGPQLGEIEAGLVAQALGIPFAIISGGVGCLFVVGLVIWRYPQLRRYDEVINTSATT